MDSGEPVQVRVARDARWSCEGCGFCCHFHELGPIEPEVIADLTERDIGAHWPRAADGAWYTTRTGPDGQETAWLAKRDGACIFLREDKLCAVHALFGAAAKPGFCQAFPFVAIRDPKGVAFVTRSDCGSAPVTAATGPAVAEQAAAALSIPNSRMLRVFQPERVDVFADVGLGLDAWMDVETDLLRAIYGLDLEPEGLTSATRSLLAEAVGFEPPPPDPGRYRMAVFAVLKALRMVMDHVIATEQAPSPAEAAFGAEMHARIGHTLERLDQPLSPLADDARKYLNMQLRTVLLGKRFVGAGSVGAGIGLFLLNATVARYDIEADGPVTSAALATVHPRWSRFTHNRSMHAILNKARPALEDMWLHATEA
jgi:Fe-S-cluster containining protein